GAQDNLSELLGCGQTALGEHRVRELLPMRYRFAANLACGVYVILHLQSLRDLGNRYSEFGKLIRLYPGTHRVLSSAKHLHSRYSGDAGQFVRQIDVAIVCQEGAVI